MLAQKNRVTKELFKKTGNQGVVLHSTLFSVRANSLTKEASKASFVVSGKVTKSAVTRNKLRRRGYEIIRELLPRFKPTQLIFFFKKEALSASQSKLKEQILITLKKYFI